MLEPNDLKLNRVERVIFEEIIEERADWSDHQVRLAAFLARELHIVLDAQQALQTTGYVTHNGRGNPVVHPLVRVVDQGIQRVCAYRRTLRITARAQGGEARDIARRRAIRKEQERNTVRDPDNLIRFPNKDRDDD
ncbi:hypothetical protein [Sphingomonas daechungensis]|uniref:hypothetical protein n=1 Tax=Sphingomonas daechungensis TaxID=1176646 RepID=UPI003783558F